MYRIRGGLLNRIEVRILSVKIPATSHNDQNCNQWAKSRPQKICKKNSPINHPWKVRITLKCIAQSNTSTISALLVLQAEAIASNGAIDKS